MAKFRRQPSHRRQPSPTAKWLVLGLTEARLVVHGQRSVHIAPVKVIPKHLRDLGIDGTKRYIPGQRLQVRAFVGGPTEARITVVAADRIQLGQVDYGLVRELGYVRLDQFQVAWVEEHDEAWSAKLLEEFPDDGWFEGRPGAIERFCRKEDRFHARHAHRDVWVIRFELDRTLPERYMAQNSEEGYTESAARGLKDEPPALHEHEWKAHVAGNRDLTHAQWVALGRLENIAARAQARAERGRTMGRRVA